MSIVSQYGFVLAQDTFRESNLPPFEPRVFLGESIERDSAELGEDDVRYVFSFETVNAIRRDSYALIYVPLSDAVVKADRLQCEDHTYRRDKDCEVVETGDIYTVVKVSGLCNYGRSDFCAPEDVVELMLTLSNTPFLKQAKDRKTFKVEVFTEDDNMIEVIQEEYLATPELSGAGMDDM